jgi:hypothetical protein
MFSQKTFSILDIILNLNKYIDYKNNVSSKDVAFIKI